MSNREEFESWQSNLNNEHYKEMNFELNWNVIKQW